jgi:methyl-accepting chemotaxis protein
MHAFGNLKIGVRLGLGFAVLIVLALLMAVYGRMQLHAVDVEVERMTDDRMAKVLVLTEIKDHTQTVARVIRNLILFTNEKDLAAEHKRLTELLASSEPLLKGLQETIRDAQGQALLAVVHSSRTPYVAAINKGRHEHGRPEGRGGGAAAVGSPPAAVRPLQGPG